MVSSDILAPVILLAALAGTALPGSAPAPAFLAGSPGLVEVGLLAGGDLGVPAGAPRLVSPAAGARVTSPLQIAGSAPGTWYFEASFPVRLEDAAGHVLARGVAEAQAPWMTEAQVPFTARLTFEAAAGETLALVLERANPSGLPEHAAEVRFPLQAAAGS